MEKPNLKSNVLPGDFLGIEEEFSPGRNTYEEEGNIYAAGLGKVALEKHSKSINVEKKRELVPISEGLIVIGRVTMVKENFVILELLAAENPHAEVVLCQTVASLPIRNVSLSYVQNMKDAYRIGDIVKARISMYSPLAIDLRTNEPNLGVIKAFCTHCRKPLHLFGTVLKCTGCGRTESRKISSDYLLK